MKFTWKCITVRSLNLRAMMASHKQLPQINEIYSPHLLLIRFVGQRKFLWTKITWHFRENLRTSELESKKTCVTFTEGYKQPEQRRKEGMLIRRKTFSLTLAVTKSCMRVNGAKLIPRQRANRISGQSCTLSDAREKKTMGGLFEAEWMSGHKGVYWKKNVAGLY